MEENKSWSETFLIRYFAVVEVPERGVEVPWVVKLDPVEDFVGVVLQAGSRDEPVVR